MTRLTASELTTTRSQDHQSDLYLGVFEPPTVWQGQINDSGITKGSVTILYDNVTTGSYINIVAGQTLYIGTTAGGDDLGRVRIRSATINAINVAPDDAINYQDNYYLTVKDFHEIWSVFPRAVLESNNTVTFYKDYDITYSDQNNNFRPTVIMGSSYFGFADEYAPNKVYFNSTGSYNVDESNPNDYTHVWYFPTGCSPFIFTGSTPGYVEFPDCGFYTVKCSVSSATGTFSDSYRHVAIFDRFRTPTCQPIFDWKLQDLSGSWEKGWIAKIEVGQGAEKLKDGYLIGIWAEDYFNGIRQSIGGYKGREHILFVGYVNSSETTFDPFTSKTTFFIKGSSMTLENKEMFSVSLEYSRDETDWSKIKNMTINKIVDHYLRYHTTLLQVVDFENIKVANGNYLEQFEDITKGDILSTINNLYNARLLANFTSDKTGKCFVEVDLNVRPTGTRPDSVMTFLDADWIDSPVFEQITDVPTSNVLMGGVSYMTGATTSSAYLSRAPGDTPTYWGKTETKSGLTLLGQSELNELSGNYLAKLNNKIPKFSQNLAIDLRSIDVVPQEFYNRNLAEQDSFRKTVWVNKRFIPRQISVKFKNGSIIPNVQLESESNGFPGDTIEIPVTAPTTTNARRVPVPTRVPRPPLRPIISDTSVVYFNLGGIATNGLYRTRNFLVSSPTWANIGSDLTRYGSPVVNDFVLDVQDPINTGFIFTGGLSVSNAIYRTRTLNNTIPTFDLVLDNTISVSQTGYGLYKLDKIIVSANGTIFVLGNTSAITVVIWHSHDKGNTWSVFEHPDFNMFGAKDMAVDGNDVWVLTQIAGGVDPADYIFYSGDGGHSFNRGAEFSTSPVNLSSGTIMVPKGDTSILYVGSSDIWIPTDAFLYKFTDGAKTFQSTQYTQIEPSFIHGYGDSPYSLSNTSSGNSLMVAYPQGIHILAMVAIRAAFRGGENPHFYLSDNAGSTWTHKSTLGQSIFWMTGFPYDPLKYYIAGSNYIGYSTDGGVTWAGKKGNLPSFSSNIHVVPQWGGA